MTYSAIPLVFTEVFPVQSEKLPKLSAYRLNTSHCVRLTGF